jgi:hypothetical protein
MSAMLFALALASTASIRMYKGDLPPQPGTLNSRTDGIDSQVPFAIHGQFGDSMQVRSCVRSIVGASCDSSWPELMGSGSASLLSRQVVIAVRFPPVTTCFAQARSGSIQSKVTSEPRSLKLAGRADGRFGDLEPHQIGLANFMNVHNQVF